MLQKENVFIGQALCLSHNVYDSNIDLFCGHFLDLNMLMTTENFKMDGVGAKCL